MYSRVCSLQFSLASHSRTCNPSLVNICVISFIQDCHCILLCSLLLSRFFPIFYEFPPPARKSFLAIFRSSKCVTASFCTRSYLIFFLFSLSSHFRSVNRFLDISCAISSIEVSHCMFLCSQLLSILLLLFSLSFHLRSVNSFLILSCSI